MADKHDSMIAAFMKGVASTRVYYPADRGFVYAPPPANGFARDAKHLYGDWTMVAGDITRATKKYAAERDDRQAHAE